MDNLNLYEVLGVAPDASDEDIKKVTAPFRFLGK